MLDSGIGIYQSHHSCRPVQIRGLYIAEICSIVVPGREGQPAEQDSRQGSVVAVRRLQLYVSLGI